MPPLFGALGPVPLLILAGLGALLFFKKLPELGRLFGRSVVEFKRGLGEAPEPAPPAAAPLGAEDRS